jgi:hypothetical protein
MSVKHDDAPPQASYAPGDLVLLARWLHDLDQVGIILNKMVTNLGASMRNKKKARRIIVETFDSKARRIVEVLLERPKRGRPKNSPKKHLKDLYFATYYELGRRQGMTDGEIFRSYFKNIEHKDEPNIDPDESDINRIKTAIDRALERLGKPSRENLRQKFPHQPTTQ